MRSPTDTEVRGFSMLEVIAVLGILSFFALISADVLQEFKRKSFDSRAKHFQHQLVLGLEGFVQDYSGPATGQIAWRHNADGTDAFVNGGEIFQNYIQIPNDPNIFFYVRYDSNCLHWQCVSGHTLSFGNVGHCLATPDSNPNTRYHLHSERNASPPIVEYYYNVAKAGRGCP